VCNTPGARSRFQFGVPQLSIFDPRPDDAAGFRHHAPRGPLADRRATTSCLALCEGKFLIGSRLRGRDERCYHDDARRRAANRSCLAAAGAVMQPLSAS